MRNFRAKIQLNDKIKVKSVWKSSFALIVEILIFNIEINTESNKNLNEFLREFTFIYHFKAYILVHSSEYIILTRIRKCQPDNIY
jgi:hypothetical protein